MESSCKHGTDNCPPMCNIEPIPDTVLPPPYDDYYLSSLVPGDLPYLIDIYNNSDLAFILLGPPYPYTQEDAQSFYDSRAHTRFPNYPGAQEVWVIRSKLHDGALIGMCGSHPAQSETRFSLGYFLVPEFRGKGIMPIVAAEVLKKFPGALFRAEAEAGNIGSQKVLEKCGFRKVEDGEYEVTWPASKGGGVRQIFTFAKKC
ncbi:hypothetical protein TWF730_000120 [Orbilia blumenaviensis]|uniref:N-acetyltransferase domain-containing protein n=1 Tax=Orbilia blumenaviensis TaxID=1796055 RepID=A0AAV9VNE7_9PEZI